MQGPLGVSLPMTLLTAPVGSLGQTDTGLVLSFPAPWVTWPRE